MRVSLQVTGHRKGFVKCYTAKTIPISDPRWHSHDELECNLVLRGQARVLVERSAYELRPHHLLWLFPGQEHQISWRSDDFALWVLVFRPDLLQSQQLLISPLLLQDDPGTVFNRRIAAEEAGILRQDCERLTAVNLPDAFFNQGLTWLLLCAWRAFQHADSADAGDRLHPTALAALQLLQDDPSASLEAVASQCQVSPAWLSRLFHRELGDTFSQHRNRLRLQRFLDRYAAGTNATSAALAAGFTSYSQCFKVVRQHLACSPRQWRAKQAGRSEA